MWLNCNRRIHQGFHISQTLLEIMCWGLASLWPIKNLAWMAQFGTFLRA
jgi:hypothetical protein